MKLQATTFTSIARWRRTLIWVACFCIWLMTTISCHPEPTLIGFRV